MTISVKGCQMPAPNGRPVSVHENSTGRRLTTLNNTRHWGLCFFGLKFTCTVISVLSPAISVNPPKKCGGLHSFSVVPGKLRGGYTEKAVPLNSVPQGCLAALTGGLGDVQGGGLT
jgi:hypothetical protein